MWIWANGRLVNLASFTELLIYARNKDIFDVVGVGNGERYTITTFTDIDDAKSWMETKRRAMNRGERAKD